jgi:hypothetical protein
MVILLGKVKIGGLSIVGDSNLRGGGNGDFGNCERLRHFQE